MCSGCSNYTAAATKTTTTKTTNAFPLPANVSAGDGIDFIEWLNLRKRDFRFFFDSFWQLRGLEYLQTTGAEGLFEFIPWIQSLSELYGGRFASNKYFKFPPPLAFQSGAKAAWDFRSAYQDSTRPLHFNAIIRGELSLLPISRGENQK